MADNRARRSKQTDSSASKDWQESEHVTPPLKAQAQRLVDEAGSVERARHAVESTAEVGQVTATDKDEFARRLGFTSFLSLFEESTALASSDRKAWFLTPLPGGGWIVWNDVNLSPSEVFPSAEEARQRGREMAGRPL